MAQPFSTVTNNEFIVISDDEDNDISNSQIYKFNKIKQEQQSDLYHINSVYVDIKKELQDLDFCHKDIQVDLTVDGCQNTMELLELLVCTCN